mgnify:CR=1 FL=1
MSKFIKHYGNYIVVAVLTVAFAILVFTGALKTSSTIILEKISINIVLAVSLCLVVGFLGELSLGHAGFMCVGAYLGGKISALVVGALGNGIPALLISLAVGGITAAVCGFIIGLPALRLKGDYLAIVTLAFGEIVKVLFQQSETFGGNLGLSTPRYPGKTFFIIGFILVLVTLFVIQNLMRSKHGRAITAIRDNEIAARATGIQVTKYKLVAFMVSAFFAGIAGVMYSYTNSTIQAAKFGYNYSIEILVMVVLGGMGSINGSIIAATLITILNEKLRTVLTGDMAVLKDMLYALILIVLVIYKNAPALRAFREKYNFKVLFDKMFKSRTDPARIRDDSAEWDRIPTKIKMDEILSVDLKVEDEYAPRRASSDRPGGKKEDK